MNKPWQELWTPVRSWYRKYGTDGPLGQRPGAGSELESEWHALWQRSASLAAAPREPLAVDKEVRLASGLDLADPPGQGLKSVDGWLRTDDAVLVLDRKGDGRVDRVGALSGEALASDGLASPPPSAATVRRRRWPRWRLSGRPPDRRAAAGDGCLRPAVRRADQPDDRLARRLRARAGGEWAVGREQCVEPWGGRAGGRRIGARCRLRRVHRLGGAGWEACCYG